MESNIKVTSILKSPLAVEYWLCLLALFKNQSKTETEKQSNYTNRGCFIQQTVISDLLRHLATELV
jgi:hypothetical protein